MRIRNPATKYGSVGTNGADVYKKITVGPYAYAVSVPVLYLKQGLVFLETYTLGGNNVPTP
jgi:hypothetical protein